MLRHGLFCFASLIIKANLGISIPENSLSKIFKFLLKRCKISSIPLLYIVTLSLREKFVRESLSNEL